jgi:hypothetical protein
MVDFQFSNCGRWATDRAVNWKPRAYYVMIWVIMKEEDIQTLQAAIGEVERMLKALIKVVKK